MLFKTELWAHSFGKGSKLNWGGPIQVSKQKYFSIKLIWSFKSSGGRISGFLLPRTGEWWIGHSIDHMILKTISLNSQKADFISGYQWSISSLSRTWSHSSVQYLWGPTPLHQASYCYWYKDWVLFTSSINAAYYLTFRASAHWGQSLYNHVFHWNMSPVSCHNNKCLVACSCPFCDEAPGVLEADAGQGHWQPQQPARGQALDGPKAHSLRLGALWWYGHFQRAG